MIDNNTKGTIWIGEVINTADPLQLGRVKLRIFGKYDELEDEAIPWSIPYNQLSSGIIVIPKIGEMCNVFFEQGDDNIPFYTGVIKNNDDLIGEYAEDYPKVWSLVYDKRMGEDGLGEVGEERTIEIFYTETQGLIIRKNESFIQISNEDESITLKNTKGNQTIIMNDVGIIATNGNTEKSIHISETGISLGTEEVSTEPAVLGDTLDTKLVEFVEAIGKLQIASPAGPCSPIAAAPTWASDVLKVFGVEKTDGGWQDCKSLLVTLDKK